MSHHAQLTLWATFLRRSAAEVIPRTPLSLNSTSLSKSPSDAIERTLKFLRQWCEFHFPRYLGTVERIQKSVFERQNLKPGDYSFFGSSLKHLFMHPAVTVLEEYGLPYTLTLQVLQKFDLGQDVDTIIFNLRHIDPNELSLSPFEEEMLNDTLENL